jgi:DNA-binding NarL/FixJ family response regulator
VGDPIRVLVVDDQAVVREGLMTLLQLAAGIEPVAAGIDGEEAVLLAARHRPDVVLMDLRMPRLDGVEATRRIRAAQPETEIVVLTTHADDQSILGALQAGARGYLTKDARDRRDRPGHPGRRRPPGAARPGRAEPPARGRNRREHGHRPADAWR